jgi:hypothetical protein
MVQLAAIRSRELAVWTNWHAGPGWVSVVFLVRRTTVVASQGIFMSVRSRSSATTTNIMQSSTVLTLSATGGTEGICFKAYGLSGPVSTLVVLTKASAELELL